MELKLYIPALPYSEDAALLIVPYGIETFYRVSLKMHIPLLIVPYGIETKQEVYFTVTCFFF